MEKFSKLMVLFILISSSFVFIACDNDDYEDQYPAKIQAEAQEFCDYWAICGTEFYGNKGDAWDDTVAGCKKYFYQNYEIFENEDYNDDNYQCYECLMERHSSYLSNVGAGLPVVDQCSLYPRLCYMLRGDCQPPEEK